jgi:hypothetical protein
VWCDVSTVRVIWCYVMVEGGHCLSEVLRVSSIQVRAEDSAKCRVSELVRSVEYLS